MDKDYRSVQECHQTFRTIVIALSVAFVLATLIGGVSYTANQNNEKVTKYGIECMKNGEEWRERNNGEAYCDK